MRSLHIGDRVLISGTICAARDAAHKRMVETLDRGNPCPWICAIRLFIMWGPLRPSRAGHRFRRPTTSGRMDAYAPRLMEKGLSGMIGKGNRSQAVKDAMQRYGTVHFAAATGGAGRCCPAASVRIRCWPMPSSARKRWRRWRSWDFPVIVVGDVEGGDYYMEGPKAYAKR